MWRHHTSPAASQQKSWCSFGGYTGHSQDFLSFHPLLVYRLRTVCFQSVKTLGISQSLLVKHSSGLTGRCPQSPSGAWTPEKTISFMSTFLSQGTSLHSCSHLRTGNSSFISVMSNMLTCRYILPCLTDLSDNRPHQGYKDPTRKANNPPKHRVVSCCRIIATPSTAEGVEIIFVCQGSWCLLDWHLH